MLIYKKATPEEIIKYRQQQQDQCKKELKNYDTAQIDILLDLFLIFCNQRNFTVKLKDVQSQAKLLNVEDDSIIFKNLLAKMALNDAPIQFKDFVNLYYQSVGYNKTENGVTEIFSTLTNQDNIDKDQLKALTEELNFQLKDNELDEILKIIAENDKDENKFVILLIQDCSVLIQQLGFLFILYKDNNNCVSS
ncbi:hypothetical protein pb186bvf_018385 [Paramecium bursaria]